jgi:dTDP-4-amino-4,6-dideoxygalactose transaminase
VVRYLGGIPLLVDCDPETSNIDFRDARRKLEQLRAGRMHASAIEIHGARYSEG